MKLFKKKNDRISKKDMLMLKDKYDADLIRVNPEYEGKPFELVWLRNYIKDDCQNLESSKIFVSSNCSIRFVDSAYDNWMNWNDIGIIDKALLCMKEIGVRLGK